MIEEELQIRENLEKKVGINLTCEMFINEVLLHLEYNKIDYEVSKLPAFLTYENSCGKIVSSSKFVKPIGGFSKDILIRDFIKSINISKKLYMYTTSLEIREDEVYFQIRSCQ